MAALRRSDSTISCVMVPMRAGPKAKAAPSRRKSSSKPRTSDTSESDSENCPSYAGDQNSWVLVLLSYSVSSRFFQEYFIDSCFISQEDSVLECVDHARLCRLQNIFIDFSKLKTLKPPIKYREDILGPGLIGGRCRLNIRLLKSLGQHKGALQSWYPELEHFTGESPR